MWWSKKKPRETVWVEEVVELIDKDPNDNTLTESSTGWESDNYCPQCLATTSREERSAGICNGCGYFDDIFTRLITSDRVVREIYYKGKWKYQYKYNNKPDGWTIEDKKL